MSLRPLSTMARKMLRPMRPKPLIATRTAMKGSLGRREKKEGGFLQLGRDGFNNTFGRDAEVLVERFRRAAGAETVHADEAALVAEDLAPAHFEPGFDRDTGLGLAEDFG